MDGAVVGWWVGWWFIRVDGGRVEIVMATYVASGFGHGKVGGVAVEVEYHVAGIVADCGVLVRSAVVQEFNDGFGGVLGALGLFRGKSVEGD